MNMHLQKDDIEIANVYLKKNPPSLLALHLLATEKSLFPRILFISTIRSCLELRVIVQVKFTIITAIPLAALQRSRICDSGAGRYHRTRACVSVSQQARGWCCQALLAEPRACSWYSTTWASACARPLHPTCPVPALFYVQLTHKEIAINCGDGCYGFIIRVKY